MAHACGFFVLFFSPRKIFYFILSHFSPVCIFSAVLSSRLHGVHVLTRCPRWGEARVPPSKVPEKKRKEKISWTVPTDSPAAWTAPFSHRPTVRKYTLFAFDSFVFQKEKTRNKTHTDWIRIEPLFYYPLSRPLHIYNSNEDRLRLFTGPNVRFSWCLNHCVRCSKRWI